jgi:rare lipoprotein A
LENLARCGEFPSLIVNDQGVLLEMVVVVKPIVNIMAKSSKIKSKVMMNKPLQSALDLLSQSRVGEVITVAPVSTKIWVQVGAFYAETSANTVFAKLKGLGNGDVSAVNQQGKTLYRVRLGPVDNVEMADDLLEKVINTGFAGARIVVD